MATEIHAVVFDMDGVLIDSHPAHLAAWAEFLRAEGITPDKESLSYVLEGRTRNEILHHFLGELTEAELAHHGHRKDDIFRSLERHIQLTPGVRDFLAQLDSAGIPRAVATSASEIRTASTIERLGIGDFFEVVVTAADVKKGKPHPDVYQLACARLGVRADDALAFDDAPAGVLAARSAGLRCIGVDANGTKDRLLAAGAETVITSFAGQSFHELCRVSYGALGGSTSAGEDKNAPPRIQL